MPRAPQPFGHIGVAGHLIVAYDRAVVSSLIVRPAQVQDVAQMARVHVRCWQETYRGLMPTPCSTIRAFQRPGSGCGLMS